MSLFVGDTRKESLLGPWPLGGWWCHFLRVTQERGQDSVANYKFDSGYVEFEELWRPLIRAA